MLKLYRRHTESCPHRNKGSDYLNCHCPLWSDGELNGRRFRRAVGTRDLQRAIRKIAIWESPDTPTLKTVSEAVDRFKQRCEILEPSTRRKYANVLSKFQTFCNRSGIEALAEVTVESLDDYRAGRKLAGTTALKELQTLRQFFGFCIARKWIASNPAKEINPPRNIKPKPVEPYTSEQISRIISACDQFGRGAYERSRARAMVLLMRYTALSISDVATLRKDRVRGGEILVRRQKTGGLVFLPVPRELQAALDSAPVPRGAGPDCEYFFWNGQTSRRAVVGIAERTLAAVFKASGVQGAHPHRFRHTLATEILANGGTDQDVADVLGNSPAVVRKHYAKWNSTRQARISSLMRTVHPGAFPTFSGTNLVQTENSSVIN